jgi:drug/metabolite transporter (DMT)-like permease
VAALKTTSRSHRVRGAALGLLAAALFGLSAPIAKMLLGAVSPVLLAGLLYLGAAAGLGLYRLIRPRTAEASLGRADVSKLIGVVLSGGVLGPVLMLFGLQRVTAVAGALLLNLEAPFTVLLAVVLFGEHLGRYAAGAVGLILGGAVALKFEPGAFATDTWGVLLIAAACLCWALDNNLTQRLSLHDPFAVVRVKVTAAGLVNIALDLAVTGGHLPAVTYLGGALLLGSLSYGVSVVLDAYALRMVGAAREAAYFATAPLVGVLVAITILGDPLHWYDLAAMGAMGLGIALLIRERHDHFHEHQAIEHDHLHEHDQHHQHEHGVEILAVGAAHSHWHRHVPLVHDHAHAPDAHHRHRH